MRCIVIPELYCTWLDDATEIGEDSSDSSSASSTCSSELSPLTAPASPFFGPASPAPAASSARTAKLEEDLLVIPAEDATILQSFESLLAEIQCNDSAASLLAQTPPESPTGIDVEDDVAAALLQSLIQGEQSNDSDSQSGSFLPDEVADFDLTFIEDPALKASSSKAPRRQRKQRKSRCDPYPAGGKNEESPEASRRGPRKKLPLEDRKLRKKEQNKTAATRYRMKKKAEVEELTVQENQLVERRTRLQQEHDDLATELRYLKKLMREAGILE